MSMSFNGMQQGVNQQQPGYVMTNKNNNNSMMLVQHNMTYGNSQVMPGGNMGIGMMPPNPYNAGNISVAKKESD
jgi:hypothetical protein